MSWAADTKGKGGLDRCVGGWEEIGCPGWSGLHVSGIRGISAGPTQRPGVHTCIIGGWIGGVGWGRGWGAFSLAGADGRLPPGCVCCSQSLTELRDAIYCLSDVNAEAVEKQVCVCLACVPALQLDGRSWTRKKERMKVGLPPPRPPAVPPAAGEREPRGQGPGAPAARQAQWLPVRGGDLLQRHAQGGGSGLLGAHPPAQQVRVSSMSAAWQADRRSHVLYVAQGGSPATGRPSRPGARPPLQCAPPLASCSACKQPCSKLCSTPRSAAL